MVDSPGGQQVAMDEVSGITMEPSETYNNVRQDCQQSCEIQSSRNTGTLYQRWSMNLWHDTPCGKRHRPSKGGIILGINIPRVNLQKILLVKDPKGSVTKKSFQCDET